MSDTTIVTELPRLTEVRDAWIELSDGCRLFARIVLPRDAEHDPVPAILEYLPYRLTDGTAHRDATHHPYLAGHGYAAVRVDQRGSGNSDGLLEDEYLPQEQADACEVIAWLARQPWCTGSVGMYGKSWGGFNALQVAAHRPPALRAVISAYSTDDRYADDVHYMGGCVLGHEALSWGSYMLGLGALPPDPEYVGERWRAMWLARLSESPVFLETWLAHQRRDAYWRQGSVGEDFSALDCAVLMVGGWADGYTNGVARTLAGLQEAGVPCRGLVGPWSHAWPEVADPGPRIGFLQECLRWWDQWLKGRDSGMLDEPLLRAWMQEAIVPAVRQPWRPGRWVTESEWPSPRITPHALYPTGAGALAPDPPADPARIRHRGDPLSGSESGAWCPYGRPTDFPPDQSAEDGRALSFTTEPLTDALEILGRAQLTLTVSVDRPRALVAARVCDVCPEGRSLLVTRGLLNLTHREGHDRIAPITPGEPMAVSVPLDFAGHRFAAGHRIRVSLSSTYWPFAWPSPQPATLELALGPATSLSLPRRPIDDDAPVPRFDAPERTAPSSGAVRTVEGRSLHRDLATGQIDSRVVVDERSHLAATGLSFGERQETAHRIVDGEPLSARLEYRAEHFLTRRDWRIRVVVNTSLSGDAEQFTLTTDVDAYEGDVAVHATRRAVRIPRDGV